MRQTRAELKKAVADQEARMDKSSTQAPGNNGGDQWSKESVYILGGATLVYDLVTLALMTYLLAKARSAEAILRTFGVTLIITAAVFLVVAGYSESQISPVIGLLGAIAGYLLGKGDKPAPAGAPRTASAETPATE